MIYYAGQADKAPDGSFRRARSTDGGATWDASAIVQAPIFFTGDRTTPAWLGDHVGLWPSGGASHIAFVENSGGTAHVAFSRIQLP